MVCSSGKIIDEEWLISNLLYSKEFSKFYDNSWKARKLAVVWCFVYYLERNAFVQSKTIGDKNIYIIKFKQYPTTNDAYLFAHEMTHVIRLSEDKLLRFGEPLLYDSEYSPEIKKVITHIFEDVAVDRFLHNNYGFDLMPYYEDTIPLSRANLIRLKSEPNGLERKILLLKLVKERLLWNIIKNKDSSNIWMNYEAWLKSECGATKTIINDRNEIISLIRDFEWDTPEQQAPIFKLIVDFCKLGDYIRLNDILNK